MANEEQLRDYLKRATADLAQVRKRLRAVEAADREPIAIVGMACRYPGGAEGRKVLRQVVADGARVTTSRAADRGQRLGHFAIVGMACRYPGGAGSRKALRRVGAEGAGVMLSRAADRGLGLGVGAPGGVGVVRDEQMFALIDGGSDGE